MGRTKGLVTPSTSLFIIEPALAALLALAAYAATHDKGDRLRHKGDKAFVVGSVLAIWFVIYFLSGLVLTYTHNALVTGWRGVALNIVGYGLTAGCLEYVRYKSMLLAGRRNVLWFGVIVALLFALPNMNLARIEDLATAEEVVKMVFSNVVPMVVASFLLTYLAATAGLPSQLTYQLGYIASVILIPVIPKHDWYLIGVSSVLLTIAVYIAIDRTRKDRLERRRVRSRHPRWAYDVMLIAVMTGLVMFMTGFFAYKPMAIVSNSMVPVFSRGSVVIAEKVNDPMDVQVGDILQYESSGKMITHRVIAIDAAADGSGNKVFITKGDNSPSRDNPVAAKQAVGIIRAQIPYIGYPTVWLRELVK
ncbi:MAG: signal peptidase I [Candidatus Saccharimonas sp.]